MSMITSKAALNIISILRWEGISKLCQQSNSIKYQKFYESVWNECSAFWEPKKLNNGIKLMMDILGKTSVKKTF